MKRPKHFMHRPGMRFDRRHIQGPDGGFIGSDIDVVTITGSVQADIRQRYSTYEITQQKVIGYPRSWEDMYESTYGIYNSGVTRTWGHGFDIGGAVSYASNFVADGGGTGIDSWNFTAFTADGYQPNTSVNYDMGGKWQALTQWKGVPTFITASSIESSLGPRGMMDLGTIRPVSGSAADVDYALRLMTTSSFLYARIPNFYNGGYGRSTVTVFKYTDATASFDIHAYGRPGDETSSQCLSVVTGNLLRWAATSSAGFEELTVPVEPDKWYIAMYLNVNLAASPRVWLGVIPFWGGTPRYTAWESFVHLNNSQTASYIGDCNFFGASSALHLAAIYMGSTGIAGVGEPVGPQFSGGLEDLQASLSAQARTKFKSTSAIDDSLTAFGTDLERRYFDQKLLGLGTGALGRTLGVTSITTGSIPSWANAHIRNSAFVATALSSSDHESQVLNFFRSGTEALEDSPVPSSSTLYYSKKTINKVVVKKTASFFDTVIRDTNPNAVFGELVPSSFTAGVGTNLTTVTGSYNGAATLQFPSPSFPGHIYFEVPQRGKLIDISVWVEMHHNSSSAVGMPLGCLGISVKPPGESRGKGNPLYDDSELKTTFSGTLFYNGTYVLWEGLGSIDANQATYNASAYTAPDAVFRTKFPSWDRDFSMRTVFNDGAEIQNPRHNIVGRTTSENYVGSPNAALGINDAWGQSTYWTGSTGSPPTGWLNGPGGTNDTNEWPTTGSNRGAARMKPVYPLLDTITTNFPPPSPGVTYPTEYRQRPVDPLKIKGTRPGLRGVEISGTWKMLFTYADPYAAGPTMYFRQARLELTYELNEEPTFERQQSSVTANRKGSKPIWQISGAIYGFTNGSPSTFFITASNTLYGDVPTEAEIGRTFGVGLNTGTLNQSSYALIYRLTGTLADISGTTPGWLLNNQFGMPRIPLSSASLVEPSVEEIVTVHPQDLLTVRPILDGAQRLSDAARDASAPVSRATAVEDAIAELDDEES